MAEMMIPQEVDEQELDDLITDVEKYDEIIQHIADQKRALDEKFKSGDFMLDTYIFLRDALSAQESDLKVQHAIANVTRTQNRSLLKHRWDWEQGRFFEDHREYTEDSILYMSLNASVKALANAMENANRSGRWFLSQAHKQVTERFVSKFEDAPQCH